MIIFIADYMVLLDLVQIRRIVAMSVFNKDKIDYFKENISTQDQVTRLVHTSRILWI